jgi:NADH-quinone oxidoreductase subunit J
LLIMIDVLRGASEVQNATSMVKVGNIGLIKTLGKALFVDYVVPFEITSVLFLSAMIGAVVIGKKE